MLGRKKFNYLLLALSFVLIGISVYLFFNQPIYKDYDISFKIEKGIVGFDINTSALTFGKVPPGSVTTRKISLRNDGKQTLIAEIFVSENLKEFIVVRDKYIIEPESEISIPVVLVVSLEEEEGEYFGKLRVKIVITRDQNISPYFLFSRIP